MVLKRREVLDTHTQRFDSDEHMTWCKGGIRELLCWEISIDTVYNPLKRIQICAQRSW